MKRGQNVSVYQLQEAGWKYLTSFGFGEVWGNDDSRIIYDRSIAKVVYTYKKDQINGEKKRPKTDDTTSYCPS